MSTNVKTCPKCGETKALSEFHKDRNSKTGVTSSCKSCRKRLRGGKQKRQYDHDRRHGKNRDQVLRTRRLWERGIRFETIAHYGGTCGCCGEKEPHFLTIVGEVSRSPYWLKSKGFPPGFTVICHNCKHCRRLHGYCWHDHQPLI